MVLDRLCLLITGSSPSICHNTDALPSNSTLCSLQNVSLIIFLLLFRTTTTYHTAHPRWHAPQQAVILGCPYVRMSVVNIQDTTIRTYVHTLPLPPEHPSATHRTYARASNQLHKTPHRSLMFSLIAHAQAEVLAPCAESWFASSQQVPTTELQCLRSTNLSHTHSPSKQFHPIQLSDSLLCRLLIHIFHKPEMYSPDTHNSHLRMYVHQSLCNIHHHHHHQHSYNNLPQPLNYSSHEGLASTYVRTYAGKTPASTYHLPNKHKIATSVIDVENSNPYPKVWTSSALIVFFIGQCTER